MSKTLEKLVEKALRTGEANLNGRKREYSYIGDLESKYRVTYNQENGDLELFHWGTSILKLGSLKASKPIVKSFYGQSKSDRDAVQFMFDYFDTGYSASYKPSTYTFVVVADFGKGELESRTI